MVGHQFRLRKTPDTVRASTLARRFRAQNRIEYVFGRLEPRFGTWTWSSELIAFASRRKLPATAPKGLATASALDEIAAALKCPYCLFGAFCHCKHCESAMALQWHELNRADGSTRKASNRKEAALMREQERRRQSVEERAETKRRRERLFRELRERAQA